MGKCAFRDCPYDTMGKKYCYYHEKCIEGDMKVYLEQWELDMAYGDLGQVPPPWVGLKIVHWVPKDIEERPEYVDRQREYLDNKYFGTVSVVELIDVVWERED